MYYALIGIYVLVCLSVAGVAAGLQWDISALWLAGGAGVLAAAVLLAVREKKAIAEGAGLVMRILPRPGR